MPSFSFCFPKEPYALLQRVLFPKTISSPEFAPSLFLLETTFNTDVDIWEEVFAIAAAIVGVNVSKALFKSAAFKVSNFATKLPSVGSVLSLSRTCDTFLAFPWVFPASSKAFTLLTTKSIYFTLLLVVKGFTSTSSNSSVAEFTFN